MARSLCLVASAEASRHGDFPCEDPYDNMDRQQRTAFYPLKDARSSYKLAIFMDSGFLVDASLEVHGGQDWAPVSYTHLTLPTILLV